MSVRRCDLGFQQRSQVLTSDSWPGSWADSLNSIVRAVVFLLQNPRVLPAMDGKRSKSTASEGAQVADRRNAAKQGLGTRVSVLLLA